MDFTGSTDRLGSGNKGEMDGLEENGRSTGSKSGRERQNIENYRESEREGWKRRCMQR